MAKYQSSWREDLPQFVRDAEKEFYEEEGVYYYDWVYFGKSQVQLDGWYGIEELEFILKTLKRLVEDGPSQVGRQD